MSDQKFTFTKSERICSKKEIEGLFVKKSNESHFSYPLKMVYQSIELGPTRILISVPKRKFKKAVDRNLLKRRIRESYRLNKYECKNPFLLGFIYVADKPEEYLQIQKAMRTLLAKLQ